MAEVGSATRPPRKRPAVGPGAPQGVVHLEAKCQNVQKFLDLPGRLDDTRQVE